jgi:hypothetical protein
VRVGREIVILWRINGEAMARLEPPISGLVGRFDAGSGGGEEDGMVGLG